MNIKRLFAIPLIFCAKICFGQAAPPAYTTVVINDTGKFGGQVVIERCNFSGTGTWTQTGANTGSESIWSMSDDYDNPVIAAAGLNTVTASFTSPAATGTTDFYTSPEVWSAAAGSSSTVTLSKTLMDFYKQTTGVTVAVPVTISGTITKEWSDSTTKEDTTTVSSGGTATFSSGGKIGIDAFELNAGQSGSVTNTVELKASNARTIAHSGSLTQNMTWGPTNYNVPSGVYLDLYFEVVVTIQTITVVYWPDANLDGVADSGARTRVYTARANPVVGRVFEFRP